ncbi:MAG: hypothetical protein ACRD0N_09340 [Acidimicrobiales bacterium]
MTEDGALRTEIEAMGIGVEPLGGDAFAVRPWAASPAGVDETIRHLIAKRRQRPVAAPEMAAQLNSDAGPAVCGLGVSLPVQPHWVWPDGKGIRRVGYGASSSAARAARLRLPAAS